MSNGKAKKTALSLVDDDAQNLDFPMANIVLREQNVRTDYTDMEELAASIRGVGIIEPLIATPVRNEAGEKTDKVTLVAGYRRYFAAKKMGLKNVPVRIMTINGPEQDVIAMIENLHRVDMNPMDRAVGLHNIMVEQQLDQKGVASLIGLSEGYISQHLGLLKLPAKAQTAIRNGKLVMTHARALSRLKNEDTILDLLKDAPSMTASELNNKVEFLLQKEKEKIAKEKEKEDAPKKRKAAGSSDDEEDEKKGLAERYADTELAPLGVKALREELRARAEKLDKAKTEASRTEHKFVLKGLEIAAGLK